MSRDKKISAEEALLIADVLERYKDYNEETVEMAAATPMELLIKQLQEETPAVQVRKRKPKKKVLHWKTRKKNEREAYRDGGKASRRRKKAELLSMGAEGWWTYQRRMWWQKKVPVTLSKEEWCETVYPTFKGNVPVIRRYSTAKPIALDNLLVTASGSKDVLFDGKEYLLRKEGYIL